MKCEKCGNQVKENDKFCTKCGAVINNTIEFTQSGESNVQNDATAIMPEETKTSTKKIAILVSAIAASVICLVIILIVVFSANASLESKLTAHNWISTYKSVTFNSKSDSVKFFKDGTYSMTLSSGTTKEGKWSINGKTLKISGRLGGGEYNFYENLSDSDISNGLAQSQYYSWYVSDKYFVICGDSVYGSDRKEIYEAN